MTIKSGGKVRVGAGTTAHIGDGNLQEQVSGGSMCGRRGRMTLG